MIVYNFHVLFYLFRALYSPWILSVYVNSANKNISLGVTDRRIGLFYSI
jgi:hypothetical protein